MKQPIGLTFAATEESQAQTDLISSSSGVNPARGIHFILMRMESQNLIIGLFYTGEAIFSVIVKLPNMRNTCVEQDRTC